MSISLCTHATNPTPRTRVPQAQQHSFNMPYQLSHPNNVEDPDSADDADVHLVEVQEGDGGWSEQPRIGSPRCSTCCLNRYRLRTLSARQRVPRRVCNIINSILAKTLPTPACSHHPGHGRVPCRVCTRTHSMVANTLLIHCPRPPARSHHAGHRRAAGQRVR